jgi:hypothetical protein
LRAVSQIAKTISRVRIASYYQIDAIARTFGFAFRVRNNPLAKDGETENDAGNILLFFQRFKKLSSTVVRLCGVETALCYSPRLGG